MLNANICHDLRTVMAEILKLKSSGSKQEVVSTLLVNSLNNLLVSLLFIENVIDSFVFCSQANKIEQLRVTGSMQLITMRKLNRLAHFRLKKVREGTDEVNVSND